MNGELSIQKVRRVQRGKKKLYFIKVVHTTVALYSKWSEAIQKLCGIDIFNA